MYIVKQLYMCAPAYVYDKMHRISLILIITTWRENYNEIVVFLLSNL